MMIKSFLRLSSKVFFGLACLLIPFHAYSDSILEPVTFVEGINVDLRQPVYSDGVLSTEMGGVITGPRLRIQAQNIVYTRKTDQGIPIYTIEAHGQLMLEFDDYVFVGNRLEFDFQSNTGIIYNGKTMVEPWFFGGEVICLCSDGSYFIKKAFVTTSEDSKTDWQLFAEEAQLSKSNLLQAKNVQFKILTLPVFWLPSFRANLDSIFDSPVRYNVKWGGRQGHRFGLVYELFSWGGCFKHLRFRILKNGEIII